MKSGRRARALIAALAILGVAAAVIVIVSMVRGWMSTGASRVKSAAPRGVIEEEQLPRISLARIDSERGEPPIPQRDVFEFGAPPATPMPPAALAAAAAAAAAAAVPTPPLEPTPIPLPPMNVRFIGAVKSAQGQWYAALLTDKKELLTGTEGDVLANRIEIVKIGHESIDVREIATGHPRRIRLGGS